ncbi:TetR/AcrR family transcriptional regulator [Actinosynnema sp. NPDC047251]|uniref:Transcriptional regulator, TetR family n=1 Tax=Saccharothrix espanaensis (strain ATCC 51144 / DSM 44229 / JCM 9112 / NBRC 15066 / NRRL 15764) TaxID=1179773 RepID=K0K5V3_SACES|nr:TetR/AcrR family transcriptional regulator [Saccharothrix espanaensis]CCH35635.1 Transcriptional regulator, TetR family [Saccharothrix espanaensis DSM 44229]
MARPKTITDERLLSATAAVIGRRGPGFTVADVAAEAGVSVGTVAQRFGSKSGLLQALTRQTTADVERRMLAAAEGADPLTGLRAGLLTWFEGMTDPVEAGNHLAQLGIDLVDPELRALLAELYAVTERTVLVLTRAVDLPNGPPPERAARVLTGLLFGVSMDWSVRPRGALADRLAQDVDAVLAAWRKGS